MKLKLSKETKQNIAIITAAVLASVAFFCSNGYPQTTLQLKTEITSAGDDDYLYIDQEVGTNTYKARKMKVSNFQQDTFNNIETVTARDSDGITFYDDGSNEAMTINDGGTVTIGSGTVTTLTSTTAGITTATITTETVTTSTITNADITNLSATTIRADGSGGIIIYDDGGNEVLDVQDGGTLQINNAYTLPTADGTKHQVLKTSGAGAVSYSPIYENAVALSEYASFSLAVTGVGSDTKTIVMDTTSTLAADLTVPANVHLFYLSGCATSLGNYTLTVAGGPGNIVAAPNQQIFSLTGTGNVAWGSPGKISVGWWGACDAADFRTTANQAVESLIDGCTLYFPSDVYTTTYATAGGHLDACFTIDEDDIHITGDGPSSRLFWNNQFADVSSIVPVFLKITGDRCEVSNLFFQGIQSGTTNKTDTSGDVILTTGEHTAIHDIIIFNGYTGIEFYTDAHFSSARNVRTYNCEHPFSIWGADNVTIDGFTVQEFEITVAIAAQYGLDAVSGDAGYVQTGVYLTDAYDCTIKNGHIRDWTRDGIRFHTQNNGCKRITVENVAFTQDSANTAAIYLTNAQDVIINDITLNGESNAYAQIYVYSVDENAGGYTAVNVENVLISNVVGVTSNRPVITLKSSAANTIDNVRIKNVMTGGSIDIDTALGNIGTIDIQNVTFTQDPWRGMGFYITGGNALDLKLRDITLDVDMVLLGGASLDSSIVVDIEGGYKPAGTDTISASNGAAITFRRFGNFDGWIESGGGFVTDGALRAGSGVWDYTVNGGTVGNHVLFSIPDNAVVTRAWYQVETALASAGSATVTMGVATDDSTGILGSTAFDDAAFNVGYHDGVPDGTAANFTTQATDQRDITFSIGTAALTAGRVRVWAEYILGK